ncbi:phosphate acyltransferase PlsX [uncultured Finegoldia sp.]|uniref:phosphate acyltransferase PlsX n=1 Tax=uncultured Finegoldia sp. TaxID=328009 RepID=UPI002610A1FA|nr:phosphate acyltransferase PlsX [uncultured Finegoldia sp.]
MKILLDTLGSDKGASELIEGALMALELKDFELTIVGNEEENKKILNGKLNNRINFVNATEIIDNNESPTKEIRTKKNSSMRKCFDLLNEDYDGLLSTGSTGALLTGATLITKRLDNVQRPCLMVILPTLKGNVVVLDVGANVDVNAELLEQFAKMGYVYAKNILAKEDCKVGLLNIGTEAHKGDSLRTQTYERLSKFPYFKGNIEARDVLNGDYDVVVTDGFSGNILLKSIEGTIEFIKTIAKNKLSKLDDKTAATLIPMFKSLSSGIDYNSIGSAPFLGTKKPVFKAHGSSNREAIKSGLLTLIKFIEEDVTNKLKEELSNE